MRISRRPKKIEPKRIYIYNEGIQAPEVLVLDSDGKSLGTMPTAEAVRRARERELDLVEINPKATPPVAKMIDYGQFRYAMEKEQRLRKAHQHVVDVKGIRLSMRIGAHDLEIRKTQSLKFLNQGDKVKVEIILRGREHQQGALAIELVKKFFTELSTIEKVHWEQDIERQGNKVTGVIAKG